MKPDSEPQVLEPDPSASATGAYPLTALTYAAATPLALDDTAREDTPRSSIMPQDLGNCLGSNSVDFHGVMFRCRIASSTRHRREPDASHAPILHSAPATPPTHHLSRRPTLPTAPPQPCPYSGAPDARDAVVLLSRPTGTRPSASSSNTSAQDELASASTEDVGVGSDSEPVPPDSSPSVDGRDPLAHDTFHRHRAGSSRRSGARRADARLSADGTRTHQASPPCGDASIDGRF